ncbi:MAG: hypothetical protein KJO28_10540 [Desulfofustis sp.]|nr:hypothetical protein [Desulfofustis sp.]
MFTPRPEATGKSGEGGRFFPAGPYSWLMTLLTIAYANHRPETLPLSQPLMEAHKQIVLEEPPHPLFSEMVHGRISTDEYLYDQDIEYPAFSHQQCDLLRSLFKADKELIQIEPYLDYLIEVQDFFAEGSGPDDLDRSTIHYQVYLREKQATRALIEYYQAVRGDDFNMLIESIKRFAQADAERFELRDRLRAQAIVSRLDGQHSTCVEAGPMHLLLFHHLRRLMPPGWSIKPVFVEIEGLNALGLKSGLYGPGDKLTVHNLFNRTLPPEVANLLCARTLIFMKIVHKEEFPEQQGPYPHLRNESRAVALVNQLSLSSCRELFMQIRDKTEKEAFTLVSAHES